MPNSQRLFFALMPNESIKSQINDLVVNKFSPDELSTVKLVQQHNYHITLLFLGHVKDELVPDIISSVQQVKMSPFELKINKTGYFQKRKVFWLGLKKAPHEEFDYLLDALTINLQRITGLDLQLGTRKFIPHITILKKLYDLSACSKLQSARFKIDWLVDKFSLVRSVQDVVGVKYEVLAEYHLN